MPPLHKLLERIQKNPTNVRFEDLDRLLLGYGYSRRSASGSHRIYSKQGCSPITIPEHRPVKEIYVKQVLRMIEEYCQSDEIED